jgi:hypothetical protein
MLKNIEHAGPKSDITYWWQYMQIMFNISAKHTFCAGTSSGLPSFKLIKDSYKVWPSKLEISCITMLNITFINYMSPDNGCSSNA